MPDEVKLVNAIEAYSRTAYGSEDDGELSRQRSLALDAYSGKNLDPAPPGRSQVTDWSVFETIQWILPSLTTIFAGGDDIVEFEPIGPEDEEAAKQESEYLNYLVTQRNNWFLTVLTWCQDALLTKNAYCMVQMEEKQDVEITKYEGQSEEQLAALLEDGAEVVEGSSRVDEQNPIPVIDPATGQPAIDPTTGQPMMQPRVLYDVRVRNIRPRKRLKFTVLPPERCKVAEDCRDFTLNDCNYFEYWDEVTISDLRKEGYDVPDDIADESMRETEEDRARDEFIESDFYRDVDSPDPSMRKVVKRLVWIRHDYDEDGIAELQRVVMVGRTILDREEVSRIPVACIVPFIDTHRHMGRSVADLVFDIQRIKTAILRQGLDSLYLANNPMKGVSNKVNLDDLLVSRPGGAVRVDTDMPDVAGHINPIPTPFVFEQAMAGMQFMDTVIESRAGVNRMFQGIDESNLNDHNRIGQLSTMAAQRVVQIARIFGNGFERLFSLAHELIIKSGHQAEAIKLRGQWVNIDPTQWKTGRDMRVVAPYAAGNKDALLQRLMIIAAAQEKAFAAGLPIVDAQNAYNLATEIAKAADVAPDKMFTDPATVPPAPPPPDYTLMALQVEDKKAETADKKVENEANESVVRAELEKFKIDTTAELERYKVDTNTALQVILAQMKEGGQVNLEEVRARLRPETPAETKAKIEKTRAETDNKAVLSAIQSLAETVGGLKDSLSAPKEVVRDDKGRVTGVRSVA